VLYVCVPVHNEAATVGVLLWRLRTVLQEAAGGAGRDYEVVVYDDASTDATADVLGPYAQVMPLTVLGGAPGGPGSAPVGASAALGALLRHVAAHARYPRRDACVVLQGDFSEAPEDLPAFLAAFDGGADLVVARRPPSETMPAPERRLRRLAPWVLRPLVRVEGVDDLLAGPRLFRVAVLRDLARAREGAALLAWSGWAGRAELAVAFTPHARRVAVVDVAPRAQVRTRASRLDWAQELRTLARFAWQARGTRVRPAAGPVVASSDDVARPRPEAPRRRPPDADAPPPERPRRAKGGPVGRAPTEAPGGVSAHGAPAAPPGDEPGAERPRALGRARRARSADAAAAASTAPTPAVEGMAAPTPAADDASREPSAAADATPTQRKRKRRSRRRAGAAPGDVGLAELDGEMTASPRMARRTARRRLRRRTMAMLREARPRANAAGGGRGDGAVRARPGYHLPTRGRDRKRAHSGIAPAHRRRPAPHAPPSVPSADRPASAE
jgi:hypothetical protein